MKVLALLSILFAAGCSPLTTNEKILFGGVLASQYADYYTTKQILDCGGCELNPVLGRDADAGDVLLFKGIVCGTVYLLGEIFPDNRKTIYTVGIVSGAVPAAINLNTYQRR